MRLIAILAATMHAGSTMPTASAGDLKTRGLPLTINVEQVTITDEDVDQAAKFCMIKEGSLERQSTNTKKPTPAQAIVMATMCK